jgi:hypothetical protein
MQELALLLFTSYSLLSLVFLPFDLPYRKRPDMCVLSFVVQDSKRCSLVREDLTNQWFPFIVFPSLMALPLQDFYLVCHTCSGDEAHNARLFILPRVDR